MVSILLDKLQTCTLILATDGDDDTMELLNENIQLTGAHFMRAVPYLLFSSHYSTFLFANISGLGIHHTAPAHSLRLIANVKDDMTVYSAFLFC